MPRRLLFAALAAGLAVASCEGVGAVAWRIATGAWPTTARLADARAAVAAPDDGADPALAPMPGAGVQRVGAAGGGPPSWQVLHPYLGFVLLPSATVNEYGFPGSAPPFAPATSATPGAPGDAHFAVGVLGGSVAEQVASRGGRALARALAEHPCLRDRNVEVFDLALPGMKQPQQLLALAWLRALGMELDLLLTLDGFNEVVLPAVENESQQVFPFYPRSWRQQVAGLRDVALMQRVGALAYAAERRRAAARWLDASSLRASRLANAAWRLVDRALERDVALRRVDLALRESENAAREGGYMATGPQRRYASDDERFRDAAALWSRATRATSDLARGAGIPSFHFLQPNQRVEGSKPMSDAERRTPLRPGTPYDRPARLGYPHLFREGEALARAGVAYTDLTRVFADVAEPLYVDDCCHVSDDGSRRLARAMAAVVRDAIGADCAIRPAGAPPPAAP